jgi:hypothetical protein
MTCKENSWRSLLKTGKGIFYFEAAERLSIPKVFGVHVQQCRALMERLKHIKPGGPYTREEMNER